MPRIGPSGTTSSKIRRFSAWYAAWSGALDDRAHSSRNHRSSCPSVHTPI